MHRTAPPGPTAAPSVAIVVASLQSGGAERVATSLAGGLAGRGWRATLVTLLEPAHDFYPVPVGVQRVALHLDGAGGPLRSVVRNLARVGALAAALDDVRPDAVVSFIDRTNVLATLAAHRCRVPIVVSERVDPGRYSAGAAWDRLRRLCYPFAQHLVSVSHGIDERFAWLPGHRRTVIHNPWLPRAAADAPVELPPGVREGRFLLGVGRLTPQKGFDLLIRAFAAAKGVDDWSLVIVGEGAERERLGRLAEEVGVAGRLFLPGVVREPVEWMRRAGLFVLSSRFEGFPNVLLEAMGAGAPVVAADCPTGPREILDDGTTGWLVTPDDPSALAAAIDEAIAHPDERVRRARAAAGSLERFAVGRHLDRWERVLTGVMRTRP